MVLDRGVEIVVDVDLRRIKIEAGVPKQRPVVSAQEPELHPKR